ncbi:MAG: valine--tRNA ligase [Planctomycetota bacterium]|jgi:valyl-tRNA synthetase
MSEPLPTRLTPEELHALETGVYSTWESSGVFAPSGDGEPFTIVIPPPNVTGILHMGHALNHTLQDVVIRYHRMAGRRALWLPGMDHAGIATQAVVEKSIRAEGKTRREVGRDAFLERVWKWKNEYGGKILEQIRRLGDSVDWSRERFTMDEGLSRAVREVFVRLFEKGLIYRGFRIVNWCPNDRTALSDDEVVHKDTKGHLWHLRYPIVGEEGKYVTVATTRPETMLGDTGVAVHPEDERYAKVLDGTVMLPLLDREIPIVADEAVDPKFGTGAVKLTPAHDPNDFEMGQRHKLSSINVMNLDGSINEHGGTFQGLSREAAREAVVKSMEEAGLLERVEEYDHSVGHCYRCDAIIEPRESQQWFVRMAPLAQAAAQATRDGRVRFFPKRWDKVYLSWLDNVRDWCISRQIWWGHRIPVWYCGDCNHVTTGTEDPTACGGCGGGSIKQDADVLDTWFSSALWPFSTLGWPADTEDLKTFYPTQTLVTDRGIIYFWVARMVMMGMEFLGEPPFKDVVIHGTILDEHGAKMSKSKKNGIDPIAMIDRYGADAVRFTLCDLSTEGQDMKLAETRFEKGRNFATKILNGSRFAIEFGLLEADDAEPAEPRLEDRWIRSRVGAAVREISAAVGEYKYSEVAGGLFRFFWDELCAIYLELVKPRLREPGPDRARAQKVLAEVMSAAIRLLHPVLPHITEKLWARLADTAPGQAAGVSGQCIAARWPEATPSDVAAEQTMNVALDVVRAVRNIRSKNDIPPSKKLKVVVSTAEESDLAALNDSAAVMQSLASAESVECGLMLEKPAACAAEVVGTLQVYVPVGGVIDREKEVARMQKQLGQRRDHLLGMRRKLENEAFLQKAPRDVVESLRDKVREVEDEIEKIRKHLDDLGAGE